MPQLIRTEGPLLLILGDQIWGDRGHVNGSRPEYLNVGRRIIWVILGTVAVPSLNPGRPRANNSVPSSHFAPSGSDFILIRSITASFAAIRATRSVSCSATAG